MDSDRSPSTYRRCWRSSPRNQVHSADKKHRIDAELCKLRQINAILNKLMPQNFGKLFAQLKQLRIRSAVTLTGLVVQIFNRAIMETTFCEMYAKLCVQLSRALPEFPNAYGGHRPITFRRVLLNLCQEEFEEGCETAQDASAASAPEEGSEEKQQRRRRRMLGNIRFLGELYKINMLPEFIMHRCIRELLGRRDAAAVEEEKEGSCHSPDKKNVEAVCILLSKIGSMIDHRRAREFMDIYFQTLARLSEEEDPNLSFRLRFMLRDLLDLRRNYWHRRRSQVMKEELELELPREIENMRLQFLFPSRSGSASASASACTHASSSSSDSESESFNNDSNCSSSSSGFKKFYRLSQPITVKWAFGNALKEDTAGDFSIFVRDLSLEVTNVLLYASFATYPSISSARVIRDHNTGRSRGFGFVSFRNRQDAESAIEEMNGKILEIRYKWVTNSANQGDEKQNSENGSDNASTNMDADQKNGSSDTHEII